MLKWFKNINATTIDFLTALLLKRTALNYFQAVTTKSSENNPIQIHNTALNTISKHTCWVLYDIPSYLETIPYSNTKRITLNTFKGTLINLKNYKNFEYFMITKFDAKRRAQFRTFEKRLNQSFNISHKIIIGNTSLSQFNTLFDALYTMLQTRFIEKEMVNDELPSWEYYRKKIYPLIQKKEAFISVIYADETPISISVNTLSDNAMYGFLKSYDTNFAKFSLGFIDLLKVTQWAFENNLEIFDFLKGHYDYKSKWTDSEYHFQKQIVYNPKSAVATTMAWFITYKIKGFYALVWILKKLRVDKLLKKSLQWKYNLTYKNTLKNTKQIVVLNTQPSNYIENFTQRTPLNINHHQTAFLKKAVYDFLFNQQDHIKNIQLFLINEQQQTYLILGTKNLQVFRYD